MSDVASDAIATLSVIAVDAHGIARPVTTRLGRPYPRPAGGWACPVAAEGLHAGLPDVIGEDSMQALALALALLGKLLTHFVSQGGRLLDIGVDPATATGDEEVPLGAYGWSANGSPGDAP